MITPVFSSGALITANQLNDLSRLVGYTLAPTPTRSGNAHPTIPTAPPDQPANILGSAKILEAPGSAISIGLSLMPPAVRNLDGTLSNIPTAAELLSLDDQAINDIVLYMRIVTDSWGRATSQVEYYTTIGEITSVMWTPPTSWSSGIAGDIYHPIITDFWQQPDWNSSDVDMSTLPIVNIGSLHMPTLFANGRPVSPVDDIETYNLLYTQIDNTVMFNALVIKSPDAQKNPGHLRISQIEQGLVMDALPAFDAIIPYGAAADPVYFGDQSFSDLLLDFCNIGVRAPSGAVIRWVISLYMDYHVMTTIDNQHTRAIQLRLTSASD